VVNMIKNLWSFFKFSTEFILTFLSFLFKYLVWFLKGVLDGVQSMIFFLTDGHPTQGVTDTVQVYFRNNTLITFEPKMSRLQMFIKFHYFFFYLESGSKMDVSTISSRWHFIFAMQYLLYLNILQFILPLKPH